MARLQCSTLNSRSTKFKVHFGGVRAAQFLGDPVNHGPVRLKAKHLAWRFNQCGESGIVRGQCHLSCRVPVPPDPDIVPLLGWKYSNLAHDEQDVFRCTIGPHRADPLCLAAAACHLKARGASGAPCAVLSKTCSTCTNSRRGRAGRNGSCQLIRPVSQDYSRSTSKANSCAAASATLNISSA
jgi:hypothetical protein